MCHEICGSIQESSGSVLRSFGRSARVPANLRGISMKILNKIAVRSEEHTSELQSLMRISYAVFCLKKKTSSKKKKTIATKLAKYPDTTPHHNNKTTCITRE